MNALYACIKNIIFFWMNDQKLTYDGQETGATAGLCWDKPTELPFFATVTISATHAEKRLIHSHKEQSHYF